MRAALTALLFGIASLGVAESARSQPADAASAAAAEVLFREGRKAADQGDHATACKKFHESNRLDPALGTRFNIADCEEKQGHLASAWTLFKEVGERLPASDDRRSIARRRAEQLEPRIPRLTLRLASSAPAESRVFRGSVELGSASLGVALPLDPGEHEIAVRAPGRTPKTYQVRLDEGQTQTLEVEAGPRSPRAAPVTEPHSTTVEERPSGSRTAGYIVGGAGIAALGLGAVAGLLVLDRKSTVDENCNADKRCNQAGVDAAESGRTWGTISTIGLAAGVFGVGVGTYLVLSSSGEGEPRATLGARSSASGAEAVFTQRW
ncbi:MAG TPA: hypothetical protein VK524_10800 [Polyangiaceae bacterium]|nr:hypothetical protein [Polyangiaceae bacterium]